jgi:S1-C subfamily serine protease
MLSRMTSAIEALSESISAAVEKAAPSVVSVSAGCRRTASGLVWSETKIVTAQRALPDGDTVSVGLADGSTREAKIVGRDPATDLALLEVDGGGLSAAPQRDGASVKLGELVIALGRPGRATRASLRMIGAIADDVPTDAGGTLRRYLETDRGIPSGFEGGPVIDASGNVLGVQSSAVVRGADLIVPAELVREIEAELAAHGKVRSGFLGVSVTPVRLPQAAIDSLGRRRGALVVAVMPNGAAERAGIHLGDVILEIDGQKIASGRHLASALRGRYDGALPISLWRTGQKIELSITPEQRG